MKRVRFPRGLAFAVVALGWYLVSCTEVPAPENGVASLSRIQRPSPGLVVGDTMRDSTGMVAPLRVIAYGVDDQPVSPQPAASFVSLDKAAHLSGNLIIGDSVGTVRVVGIVGSLQTNGDTIPVTLSPDTLVQSDSILHRVKYTVGSDTVATSAELGALVQHRTPPGAVQAVIVKFTITKAPVGTGSPTAVLVSNNRVSDRDTTDVSGKASRAARLRLGALNPSTSDTVMVSATSSYRGKTLGVVTFTVVFTKQ